MNKYNFKNITLGAPTTTTVKTGSGVLHNITINKATASAVIAIYDGAAATGTLIGTITMPATLLQTSVSLNYDVAFVTNLTIVTTTAQDITISFE
jgi:hypothetical protein